MKNIAVAPFYHLFYLDVIVDRIKTQDSLRTKWNILVHIALCLSPYFVWEKRRPRHPFTFRGGQAERTNGLQKAARKYHFDVRSSLASFFLWMVSSSIVMITTGHVSTICRPCHSLLFCKGEIMWCWIANFHVPRSWICKGVVSSTEVHNWNYNSSKWWGVLNHPFRYYLVFFLAWLLMAVASCLDFGCITRPAFFMIFGLLPVPVGKQFVYSIEFCFGFG